ncbi:TetR/AcrR family transcriptional regulator [Mycobacterium sp. Aquia_216]|uniref:TetR/AcrR family transcriptional regulator n=1 Tax=Mycobacterium sp. Aquia_216 TaxID=2991729 RepID=UPI00227A1CBD|nr:TetR/AcrR family transcriptional regulator [Mycobacterium sp. Aquia_216]WAJ43322.1 TetR/AcrR family transcriptional regulator [Mycobacterium sp. Aquia_216]
MERLLADQPLHEVSVEKILQASGVSRAAFYYYFSSKYDVVASLAETVLDEIYHLLDAWTDSDGEPSPALLQRGLRSGVDLWTTHGPLLAAMIENMHAADGLKESWVGFLDRFTQAVAAKIEGDRRNGTAPRGLPADAVAGVLVWSAERLLYLGLRGLDPAVPTVEAAGNALIVLWTAAIYGEVDMQSAAT